MGPLSTESCASKGPARLPTPKVTLRPLPPPEAPEQQATHWGPVCEAKATDGAAARHTVGRFGF
eukprot:9253049-Pyramimonas_sp.AAC.1